jgi:cellulose synthase operon protein C
MGPSAQERAFAAEVERCRVAARVNQQWIAQRVGLSRPKISEICHGRFLPSRQVLDELVTALAMDRERAVGLWREALIARDARRRSKQMAGHQAPSGWAEIPVLPADVRSLLRAQILAAVDLPYRLPGARNPSLATVYVRQDLGSGTDDPPPEQPRTEPMRDGKVPMNLPEAPTVRLAVRPPSRTIRAALDGDDHLLVTGGPGQGKSTLSLRLAAGIAEAWSTRPDDETAPLSEPVVPLRLTARELATRLDLPFAQALAESVRAEYGSLLRTDLGADLLGDRVAGCRWLLLVDGLDEVADVVERDRVVTVLAAGASDPTGSPYRVLLTTRPVEGSALAPLQRVAATRYELQAFDEEALRRFAENWFAEEGHEMAERFIHQVRQAHLDELVSVPLLATIAAIIFGQPGDLPLPDNEYELYEAYLGFLRAARTAEGPFEHVRAPLLEHLGRVRLEADTPLTTAAHKWLTEHDPAARRVVGWQDELLTFLTLTGPLMLRGGDLRFLHHSFAEHLAATATARELLELFEPTHDAFIHLLHVARQEIRGRYARAVLLHYTHLRPTQADTLVDWLHSGTANDQLLAARLLAKHVPTSPGVVDAFLRTARSWAMTTQYSGGEILRNVTRAAHHPGLGPWLVDLSRDENAPWQTRVTAATALAARLHGPDRDAAAELLRVATEDDSIPILCRLDAAEGLAECGMRHRATAERALRMVVADATVPPVRRRGATVVLARLGPAARAHAIGVLLASLEDPWTPTRELVQSATGLAEIGAEFHERCADVFRRVLGDHTRMRPGARDAALGLAALGPQHLVEAVEALIAFAANRSADYFDRSDAAEALGELGPQYQAASGELLLNMLAEPVDHFLYRGWCTRALSRLGAGFQQQAAAHLRELLVNHEGQEVGDTQAAQGMVDLGPAYHAEAAEALWRVADDPIVLAVNRAHALGQLANLGERQREPATRRLLEQLTGHGADPEAVARAASELARLDPTFHAEITASLIRLIDRPPLNDNVHSVCSTLTKLGTQFQDMAAKTLVSVFTVPGMEINTMCNAARQLADLGPENRGRAANLLVGLLDDPKRTDMQRIRTAWELVQLGREYHRTVVERILQLLCRDAGTDVRFDIGLRFSQLGVGPRTELAQALCAQTSDPHAGPKRILWLSTAIVQLSSEHVPHVVEMLEMIMSDESADYFTRSRAAVELATLVPERVSEAVVLVRAFVTSVHLPWTLRNVCFNLAMLGDDPVPLIRATLAEQGTERALREEAASVFLELDPKAAAEAVVELRHQAADEHLDYWRRTEVMFRLAQHDPSARGSAIDFHTALLNDEEQPTPVRSHAARQLVRLDRTHWKVAVDIVRHLLTDPFASSIDRHAATIALGRLRGLTAGELRREIFALVRDSGLDPKKRQELVGLLRLTERMDAQRILLADHGSSIRQRVPYFPMDGCLLPIESETAIREVLTAPEFRRAERVQAAAALAELSYPHVPEAARALTELATAGGTIQFQAISELTSLDGPYGFDALRMAERVVLDESAATRERFLAARLLVDVDFDPKPFVVDFLHEVAAGENSSDPHRVGAMFALRHIDGVEPLRKLRDDDNTRAAARMDAAAKLIAYRSDDRAAATSVIGHIASDRKTHPGLRRRAAEILTQLGQPGRTRAIEALRSMVLDAGLSVTARAAAARQLVEACPYRVGEVIGVLRELATDDLLRRRQILVALGTIVPAEATPPLRRMAMDTSLHPVVRLRCAESLADPRIDQRDTASLVARELMHDQRLPWHTRRRAARDLARWSEPCRQEAREMIHRIKIDGVALHVGLGVRAGGCGA